MGQRFFSAAHVQMPLLLGPSDRHVFAIYHPPVQAASLALTVICPPLLNEYMRTQLALRELAVGLCEKGHAVMRFDYRGTGDSAGELEDLLVSDWLEDIRLVVRKGLELSGSSRVRLLGVRAGALLACTAVGLLGDVERVVLWDPVPGGTQYLEKMREIQHSIIEQSASRRHRHDDSVHEYAGYRLSQGMVEELSSLDTGTYRNLAKSKVRIIATSQQQFETGEINQDIADFACDWETELDNLMMPKPVLERIAACLTAS